MFEMNLMSMASARFILVIISIYGGLATVGVKGSCSYNEAFLRCLPNRTYLNRTMTIQTIFNLFQRELTESCSRLSEMSNCIEDANKKCPAEDGNLLQKIWKKAKFGINYVCEDKIKVFTSNRACLIKQETVSSASSCQTPLDRDDDRHRHRRHTCSVYNTAVSCVQDVVTKHCGSEAGNALSRVVRNFLSLSDVDHDCDRNSSAVTVGSFLMLILSTALLLSVLS